MIFEDLLADSKTDQYTYRADVINAEDDAVADGCGGTGLGGVGQYTAQLDAGKDGQDSVPGVIDALCPPGRYTLTVTLMATSGLRVIVNQAFQVLESAPSVIEEDEPPATPTPTATATATATATNTPTATSTNRPPDPPQQSPPQQPPPPPPPTATPTPTATPVPTPTATPTVKVVYVPPPQQKEEPPQLPTPTHTPTATPLQRQRQRRPSRRPPRPRPQQRLRPRQLQRRTRQTGRLASIQPIIVNQETGADSGEATPAPQPTVAAEDSGDGSSQHNWHHYAAGRSVWNCQDLTRAGRLAGDAPNDNDRRQLAAGDHAAGDHARPPGAGSEL